MASTSSVFPIREPVEKKASPSVVSLDTADKVFEALRSTTARSLVTELYEGPATATDLAEAVDTSLQNAQYHLERLREAELIEPVDTWYSERGREMTVFAPTADPLVLWAGPASAEEAVRGVLENAA